MKINGNAPQSPERPAGTQQSKTGERAKTQAATPTSEGNERVKLSNEGSKIHAQERDLAESRKLIDMIDSGKLSSADEALAIKRVDEIHRKYQSS